MKPTPTKRKRKTEWLTGNDKKGLNALVKSVPSIQDAADKIGISRQVLDRVLLIHRASPENVELIRKAIR